MRGIGIVSRADLRGYAKPVRVTVPEPIIRPPRQRVQVHGFIYGLAGARDRSRGGEEGATLRA
jgi:hypothetical protein